MLLTVGEDHPIDTILPSPKIAAAAAAVVIILIMREEVFTSLPMLQITTLKPPLTKLKERKSEKPGLLSRQHDPRPGISSIEIEFIFQIKSLAALFPIADRTQL